MVSDVGISINSELVVMLCVDTTSSGMRWPLTLSSDNGINGDSVSMILSTCSIVSGVE